MRLRPLPLAAAVLAASALACSDGNGPDASTGERLLVVRTQAAQQSLWEYAGTTARRVSPDSVRFVFSIARATDGRLAWVTLRTDVTPIRYALVEAAAGGAVLRRVDLERADLGMSEAPTELSYSPDGTRLAWRSRPDNINDSLFVLDAGATTRRGLASRRAQEALEEGSIAAPPMRWAPSGRIVFGPARSLVGVHAGSGDTLTLAANLGHVPDYDFALDGRLAVVTRSPGAPSARILVQRAASGPLIQIPGSAAADAMRVRWARDGRRVATTARDSVPGMGGWIHFGVPQLMTIDGSVLPERITGVAVAALHGWTRDGRLIITGAPPSSLPFGPRDVFVAFSGTAAVNLTNTSVADETDVLVVP